MVDGAFRELMVAGTDMGNFPELESEDVANPVEGRAGDRGPCRAGAGV